MRSPDDVLQDCPCGRRVHRSEGFEHGQTWLCNRCSLGPGGITFGVLLGMLIAAIVALGSQLCSG
jgi:hypothetical protein